MRKNAGKNANFERRDTKKGQPYFVLKAANNEVIGQRETYVEAGQFHLQVDCKDHLRMSALKFGL